MDEPLERLVEVLGVGLALVGSGIIAKKLYNRYNASKKTTDNVITEEMDEILFQRYQSFLEGDLDRKFYTTISGDRTSYKDIIIKSDVQGFQIYAEGTGKAGSKIIQSPGEITGYRLTVTLSVEQQRKKEIIFDSGRFRKMKDEDPQKNGTLKCNLAPDRLKLVQMINFIENYINTGQSIENLRNSISRERLNIYIST